MTVTQTKPAKRGRKPTWRDGNLELAKKLAALGATDAEMAKSFRVSLRTFMHWKVSHPEFLHTLKLGKEAADTRVERRLWERAVGYSVVTEKIFCPRGRVIRVETVEHYPADTTAMIFWLKNRQPGRWRDRAEVEHQHLFNFIGMLPSEEEWRARYAPGDPIVIESRMPQIEEEDKDS